MFLSSTWIIEIACSILLVRRHRLLPSKKMRIPHKRVSLLLLFNTTPRYYLINFHSPSSSSSSLCRSQHLLTTMMGTFKADVRTRGSVFWSHFYPFHTLEHQHRVDRKFFWNSTTAGGLPTMKTTRSSLFDDEQVLGLRNEFPEEHIDFRAGGFFGTR